MLVFVCAHILLYFFSIYWSDTSLRETLYAPKLIVHVSFETFHTILIFFLFFPSFTHVLLKTFKEGYSDILVHHRISTLVRFQGVLPVLPSTCM